MILYSFIIINIRMTPLLNKHNDIHWEKVWLFILISVFIISDFGFQKSLGNLNFGFDFLAMVRFQFLKTATELTFGLPHIPSTCP